jgi:hypothetical protein
MEFVNAIAARFADEPLGGRYRMAERLGAGGISSSGMKVLVTVRRNNGLGEVLGTFLHPEPYASRLVNVGGRPFEVVATEEGPNRQTLYVVAAAR